MAWESIPETETRDLRERGTRRGIRRRERFRAGKSTDLEGVKDHATPIQRSGSALFRAIATRQAAASKGLPIARKFPTLASPVWSFQPRAAEEESPAACLCVLRNGHWGGNRESKRERDAVSRPAVARAASQPKKRRKPE
jgi:hypothetical protein